MSGIVDRLLDLPDEEREPYLSDTCSGDAALREEVERLLRELEGGRGARLWVDGLLGGALGSVLNEGSDGVAADAASAPALLGAHLVGARIGKYEVLGLIGQGGMGAVYRARDPVIGRDVAVKVILARALGGGADARARFYREARAAGALTHENVVTIHDVGEDPRYGGLPYIVMELLDGVDLRRLLGRRPLPPLALRLDLAAQVARGLAYAHAHGVVHRDVKPENVRVTGRGRTKLLDFGIARRSAEPASPTGWGVGTPRYMAPEQITGKPIDHRSDVFSFGTTLYELLTGVCPFQGEHVSAVIYQVLNGEPPLLTLGDDGVGPVAQRTLDGVVRRCLEKEPARRYDDLAEVAAALEAVCETLYSVPATGTAVEPATAERQALAAVSAPTRAPAQGPRLPAPIRRRVQWLGAAAVLLIAATAAAVLTPSFTAEADGPLPAGLEPAEKLPGNVRAARTGAASALVPAPMPEGILSVRSEPGGARVIVDGADRGVTPLQLSIEAGPHRIRLEKGGYTPFHGDAHVPPSEAADFAATLQPAPPPVPAGEGMLHVSVRPWGSVTVDGAPRLPNVSFPRQFALPAGEYIVAVEHPELGRREHRVTITDGQATVLGTDLRPADVTVTAFDSTGAPLLGEIYLDGVSTGRWAPGVLQDVRQGTHRFEVRNGGRRAGPETVVLSSGAPSQVRLNERGG